MNQIISPYTYKKTVPPMKVYPTQMETQSLGRLRVRCTAAGERPIENATVRITNRADPNTVIDELTTDISGLTEVIDLPAPPLDYSLAPNEPRPYAEYDALISAPGFEGAEFFGIQILPDVTAEQNTTLNPAVLEPTGAEEVFDIAPHTLYYEYPPKIPEEEINPAAETGAIVLNRVVIPEFVIVHDGPPSSSAPNYYVRFRDYIKNVASSEIYATWPEATIYANILAILSFTLNRVFTEWYTNQGYNFTVTSSTAYDQKWTRGRNIYDNIGVLVDNIFVNYLSRPNVRQPILTQYCDGVRVQCPGWMSQWGSKDLGDQGLTAIQILRNYYGNSIFINTAPEVSGVPRSWPGSNLTIRSTGENVRTIQEQLNRIADVYTAIPKVAVDGIFGSRTAAAVKAFQEIFNLPDNGIVDRGTWYKISGIYVALTRMAEL